MLCVNTLGIVFGGLGTSPLYVYPTIFANYDNFTEDDILGCQCLITYSLIIIVCIKYFFFVLTADNKGEGGIFALLALIPFPQDRQDEPAKKKKKTDPPPDSARLEGLPTPTTSQTPLSPYTTSSDNNNKDNKQQGVNGDNIESGTKPQEEKRKTFVFQRLVKGACYFFAYVGAAFILGDGAITPAISVLSAIEGVNIKIPSFSDGEVPLALFILLILFLIQSRGSSTVGILMGPVMLLFFLAIFAVGLYNVIIYPSVLYSFNPQYGYLFFKNNGGQGFILLGGIVLSITGVESLYADLGHFGTAPIRVSWIFLVFPSLMLSYMGQVNAFCYLICFIMLFFCCFYCCCFLFFFLLTK